MMYQGATVAHKRKSGIGVDSIHRAHRTTDRAYGDTISSRENRIGSSAGTVQIDSADLCCLQLPKLSPPLGTLVLG